MPARVLVPLRPAPATKRTFRGTPSGFISSMALGCSVTAGSLPASGLPRPCPRVVAHEAPLLPGTAPRGGDPGVGRGGLPRRLHAIAPRPDAPALGGGDRRRRGDRPHRRDRRRVGAPRQPHQRRPLRQRRPRRRPQPRRPARARRLPRLPRLRRRAAAHGVRRPGGRARRLGLRLRDRLDRALGGRPAGRAAVDAAPPPAGAGCARRGPARDPRRRLRLEQGVPQVVVGRARAVVARGRALRGPAHHDAGVPRGQVRRARRGRLPLADPRGLDHPDPGLLAAGPRRPLGDQADVARLGARPRVGRGRGRLRRPGAGRRPVALLPAGARVHARVVAAAALRRARALGPTLARAQRPAAGPPARRLARGAGPPRRRRRADGVGGHARRPGAPGAGRGDRGLAAVGAALGARRDHRGSRSAGAAGPRGRR